MSGGLKRDTLEGEMQRRRWGRWSERGLLVWEMERERSAGENGLTGSLWIA